MGRIIPCIMENRKCLKPLTSLGKLQYITNLNLAAIWGIISPINHDSSCFDVGKVSKLLDFSTFSTIEGLLTNPQT